MKSEGMMDTRAARCETICGENTAGCFMANKNHLECITDIVINRVWAAREIIELGAHEHDARHASVLLSAATDELDELVHGLQEFRVEKKTV
jgi:hypothetical protein